MDYKDLQPYQSAFYNYLKSLRYGGKEPVTLFEPIDYVMSLAGKRIRPLVTLLSCHLFRNDYSVALPQALAIETFHNFTLVHDDIMDRASLRRGQESTHERFGTNTAILAGDALFIMAYDYLSRGISDSQLRKILGLFTTAALDICIGQQLDMDFESKKDVEQKEYFEMIEKKTATLFGTAMAIGACVGDASDQDVEVLKTCGVAAGIAFQIHDDYLDVFGDPAKTGKVKGGDIMQGKKTYPWLIARELGGSRIGEELDAIADGEDVDPQSKVKRVTDIYKSLAIDQHCLSIQRQYAEQATSALHQVNADSAGKQRLFDLLALLLSRQY